MVVNMTSSTNHDIDTYYPRITSQLARIIPPILYGIGSVGAVLSCIVFAQKTMRQNPASIYFLAFSIINFFDLLVLLLVFTVPASNSFDLSLNSIAYCKIRFYCQIVFPTLSRYYLIMAGIDRTLVTSSNALTRQRSTRHLAYRSITVVTLIILLYNVHLLVNINIYQVYPGRYLYYTQPGNYSIFYTFSQFVLSGLVPWVLSIVLAILTMKNLRRVRIQTVNRIPTVTTPRRSKDRQFAVMLLAEIINFILFTSVSYGLGVYLRITQYQTKSTEQKTLEEFLQALFYMISYIFSATSFYLYLAVSKTFRQKTTEVLCKLRFLHRNC